MAAKERRPSLFAIFIAAMCFMILIGLLLIIYGSLHNTAPVPTLTGPGLYAGGLPHA